MKRLIESLKAGYVITLIITLLVSSLIGPFLLMIIFKNLLWLFAYIPACFIFVSTIAYVEGGR